MIYKRLRVLVLSLTAVIVPFILQACAVGGTLRTDVALEGNVQGTYTLIRYGGNYGDDLETIAFLDKEGDQYTFEPYAPEFVFSLHKGLPADIALREAGQFIRSHVEFWREQIRSIRDEKGEIVGYELRPLYFPISYGTDDVLEVDYRMKEERVLIFVKLKPSLERRNFDFDSDER